MIDTGASHSLISQDEVDEIGIQVRMDDEIITSYGIGGKKHSFSKRIEEIQVGDFILKDVYIDFTSFKYHNINGLLGLDILTEGEFAIDLKEFKLLRS
ncbi:retropepsin-like aspartic protease [Paenibacillus polymyxa]